MKKWTSRVWPVRVWVERCRRRRNAEVDRQYGEAYRRVPLDTPDAWGDLESFLNARHGRD